MKSAKHNENENLKYLKKIISDSIGEEFWEGFCDIITTEKPRVDIYENNDTIIVTAEIPGVLNPDDILIDIASNKLTIRGESKDKYQYNNPGRKIKGECVYGTFNRCIELPHPVEEDNIDAAYESGILEIKMQRIDKSENRNVKIQFKK